MRVSGNGDSPSVRLPKRLGPQVQCRDEAQDQVGRHRQDVVRISRTCGAQQICFGVYALLCAPAREDLGLKEVGAADIFDSRVEDDWVFVGIKTRALKGQENSWPRVKVLSSAWSKGQ